MDLSCTADDTPMPMIDLPNKLRQDQVRRSRNFGNLIRWSHELERDACYIDGRIIKPLGVTERLRCLLFGVKIQGTSHFSRHILRNGDIRLHMANKGPSGCVSVESSRILIRQ